MTKSLKKPIASSPNQGIQRAQELVRVYIPEPRQLSEELIKERRDEASQE